MKIQLFLLAACTAPLFVHAQLTVQKGAGLLLQENTTISIEGDLEASENIEGHGAFILNGPTHQNISLYGNAVPSITIENGNNVSLSSPLKINKNLSLKSGRLILGRYNLELGVEASASGNENAYITTGNGGKVVKQVQTDLHDFIVPLGTNTGYSPVMLQSSGKYNAASVAISAKAASHPDMPASSRDYLNNYWTINRKGVAGVVLATAFCDQVTGEEENLRPFLWNGHQWITRETSVDTRNKLLNMEVPEGSCEIYAMRKGDELTPVAASIVLLPNPVRNMATVVIRSSVTEKAVLQIVNSAGATVIAQPVNLRKGVNQVNINVTFLAKGQYVITSAQKNIKAVSMIKQ